MALKYLLMMLPTLALARIDVDFSGQFDVDNPNLKVQFSGEDVSVISDEERNTFKLSDQNLKRGSEAYYGRRPDDVYLRSPTPWGDLYQTYNWKQVVRTLKPKSGKILSVSSTPLIVVDQYFENNSTKPAVFNVGISQTVENRASSSWSKGGELTVGQEINYGFDFEVISGGGSTSISYTSSWGRNTEKSQSVVVGSTSELQMTLQPGQAVTAQLQATKGTIRIEMEYEASVSGQVATNYDDVYKGHHFWGFDVTAVMSNANLENNVRSKEVIQIDFYTRSKVIVRDSKGGNKLLDRAF